MAIIGMDKYGLKELYGVEAIQGMTALWRDVFGDSDEYIDLVLRSWYTPAISMLWADDKGPAAMLLGHKFNIVVPKCRVADNAAMLRGIYLSGLATREDMRGCGIMTQMIREIYSRAVRHKYDLLFLIPASESLRKWYERFSFFNTGLRYTLDVSAVELDCGFLNSIPCCTGESKWYSEVDGRYMSEQEKYINSTLARMRYFDHNVSAAQIFYSSDDIFTALIENKISGGDTLLYYSEEDIALSDRNEKYSTNADDRCSMRFAHSADRGVDAALAPGDMLCDNDMYIKSASASGGVAWLTYEDKRVDVRCWRADTLAILKGMLRDVLDGFSVDKLRLYCTPEQYSQLIGMTSEVSPDISHCPDSGTLCHSHKMDIEAKFPDWQSEEYAMAAILRDDINLRNYNFCPSLLLD